MNIIIGKLGNQPFPITEASVSRHHAELVVNDVTGQMTLHDTNSANGTYILDKGSFVRIKQAHVSMDTLVRVGASVTFKIRDLLRSEVKEPSAIDISRLRFVYDNYNHNKMEIETAMGNIMMLRIAAFSISGLLGTMLTLFIPKDTLGDETTTKVISVLGTLCVMLLSLFFVSLRNKSLLQRKYDNEDYFKRKYRCSKCGYTFGTRPFDNLIAEGKCPNPSCRCKFTAKK